MARRPAHRHFAVGSALTTSLRLFRGDALAFTAFALLSVLPQVPFAWLSYLDGRAHRTEESHPLRLLWALGASIPSMVAFAAGIAFAMSTLRSEPAGIGASLAAAARRWAPLAGLLLLSGLVSFVLAMTAAIHPSVAVCVLLTVGVALALAYGLAYPVVVVERLGVLASLRRAAELTAGRRLALLGLAITCCALVATLWMTLLMGFGMILGIAGAGGDDTATTVAVAVITIGLYLLFSALSPVVMAVAYHDLRRDVDGVPADSLASVFE